jgi:hypothetical protein
VCFAIIRGAPAARAGLPRASPGGRPAWVQLQAVAGERSTSSDAIHTLGHSPKHCNSKAHGSLKTEPCFYFMRMARMV